ncbi:MAG: cupin [Oscillatoriales cyanobacterium SM2_2_1]|nr:cupin [Oscillatoriales cyanobacterium SM2_2_1]
MDWLVDDAGICQALSPRKFPFLPSPYRLYHFLTDLDALLEQSPHPQDLLPQLFPRVAHLLHTSPWLQWPDLTPDADLGWAVQTLYDEPNYPITVQRVAWAANGRSPVHNHATWGLVAQVVGTEVNHLWRRVAPDSDAVAPAGDYPLRAGDMIGFYPNAIHSIAAGDDAPTLTFNLYGLTDYQQRWQFDPSTGTAQLF